MSLFHGEIEEGDLCLFIKVRDSRLGTNILGLSADFVVLERKKRFWVFADLLGGGRVWIPDSTVESEGWIFVRVLRRGGEEV